MKIHKSLSLFVAMGLLAAGCSVHRLGDEQAGEESTDLEAVEAPVDPSAATTVPVTTAGTDAPPPTSAPESPAVTAAPVAPRPGTPTTARSKRPTATSVGRTPTANAAGAEPRLASSIGVTENEIKMGILTTSEDFFASVGGGGTKKAEQIIGPFIEEINAQGGINGRKVVPKITRYDPLSADNMKAACVQQADDHKVFAAIAQIGFYGDAEICMATKKVPLITGNNSSAHTNYEREKGWVRQTQMNKDRNLKSWIDWMISSKTMTAQTKLGLLYVDVPEDAQLAKEVILPYLKEKGMQAPEIGTFSASIAQTPGEAQVAVVRFKTNNVQLVLPLTSFLRMLIFTQQAEAANYRPKYSVSDFGLLASDATANFPPAQWTGVTGITTTRVGENEPGQAPTTAGYKECEAVYNKYGQKIGRDPNDASRPDGVEVGQMMHYCQHIALWADVARRAGVNPTRESFLTAVGQTATWTHRVVLTERLSFGPRKYDGADLIATVRWQPGCSSAGGCFRRIEGFRKATW